MIPTRNHERNFIGNDVLPQLIQCFLKAKNHCSEPIVPTDSGFPKSKHLEAPRQHKQTATEKSTETPKCAPTLTVTADGNYTHRAASKGKAITEEWHRQFSKATASSAGRATVTGSFTDLLSG